MEIYSPLSPTSLPSSPPSRWRAARWRSTSASEGASAGQPARASTESRVRTTNIASLAPATVHSGCGRSISSTASPGATRPSSSTRKYHPVRPVFCTRAERSLIPHRRLVLPLHREVLAERAVRHLDPQLGPPRRIVRGGVGQRGLVGAAVEPPVGHAVALQVQPPQPHRRVHGL